MKYTENGDTVTPGRITVFHMQQGIFPFRFYKTH